MKSSLLEKGYSEKRTEKLKMKFNFSEERIETKGQRAIIWYNLKIPNLKAKANPEVSNCCYRFDKNNTFLLYIDISGKYCSTLTVRSLCDH